MMRISVPGSLIAFSFAGALALGFGLVPAAAGPISATDLGDVPPELKNIQWMAAADVRLSELRGKSVCVVDFFRTWYAPCRFQLLEESAAQKGLGTGAVTFIGLTDEPAWLVQALRDELPRDFVWHAGLDRNDATLKALLGPVDNQEQKMASALPRTMIIDKAGRVVYFGAPPDNLRTLVGEIVAGTWDVGRARKRREDERLLVELTGELISTPPGKGERIVVLADRLAGLEIPDSLAYRRSDAMHNAAVKLLDDETSRGKYDRQALKYAYMGTEGHPWYAVYETLAKALLRTGDLKEAVAAQKKAVSVVGDEGIKSRLQKQLTEYAAALASKTGEVVDVGDSPKAATSKPAAPESNVPPSELTSAQAVEDLERLHTIILNGYAGYDDFEWKLRLAGSSWRERLKSCQEKAAGRAAWPIDEFFSLAAEFLRPIVDEHFYIALTDAEGKGFRRWEKFTVRHSAFFTDLRIVASGGRMVVRSADPAHKDLIGREVRQIPVVSVESAALDTPFLFPTVPESAAPEYLLGVFLAAEPGEPKSFTFHADGGRSSDVRLALHRCRVKNPNAGKGEPWSMRASGDTPLPVLSVRTADEDKLTEGFLKSAETLRGAAAAILDLRANGGGSDIVAEDWCGLFFPQEYQAGTGNAIVAGGKGSVSQRWNPLSVDRPRRLEGPQGRNPAKESFRGTLFIVTDINTASSGETYAGLARQIPGAVLVGENTRGCTLYGNADIVKRLPASRIAVRFGWVRFSWAGVFPIREGVGFFPDYWIDEADPYPALAKLASLVKRGRT